MPRITVVGSEMYQRPCCKYCEKRVFDLKRYKRQQNLYMNLSTHDRKQIAHLSSDDTVFSCNIQANDTGTLTCLTIC